MNFAHSINGAHYDLIEMPSNQQTCFLAQCYLDDTPDELTDFVIHAESVAHVEDCLSSHLEHSLEEDLQWF